MTGLPKGSTTVLVVLGVCAVLVAGMSFWLSGDMETLRGTTASEDSADTLPAPFTIEELALYEAAITNPMNPIAVISTNRGEIEIELFEDTMPITVGNFAKLAEEGFYDGTKFHRVIENFMVQGGDPLTKTDEVMRYGTGGPGYAIADEHVAGEFLTNVRGTIAMANSGLQSGGSQFFINVGDNIFLDFDKEPLSSKHPVFGRVVKGMEVVDGISTVETNVADMPIESIVVEKVEIRRGS